MHSGGAIACATDRGAGAEADNQKSADLGGDSHRHGERVSGMSTESDVEGRD